MKNGNPSSRLYKIIHTSNLQYEKKGLLAGTYDFMVHFCEPYKPYLHSLAPEKTSYLLRIRTLTNQPQVPQIRVFRDGRCPLGQVLVVNLQYAYIHTAHMHKKENDLITSMHTIQMKSYEGISQIFIFKYFVLNSSLNIF